MDIVDDQARELCSFLIHFIREKFKYELESPVYQVSLKIIRILELLNKKIQSNPFNSNSHGTEKKVRINRCSN